MFKNLLWKNYNLILPLIISPIIVNHSQSYQCFTLWGSKLKKNIMKQRVYTNVLISNHPCEDRYDSRQLEAVNGYAVAVYDGHGGWQVSQFCKENLLNFLQQALEKKAHKLNTNNQEQIIKDAIYQAFQKTQNKFLEAAKIGYNIGFGRMGRVGSCALISVVINNKIYTGNAGDSLAILIEEKSKTMDYRQLNYEQNANRQSQKIRLKSKFPNEKDIVICKKQETHCYVKGRLQPTRSIGDFRLKYHQFNNPKNYQSQDYQSPLKIFSGNYINWQPEIKVFNLNKTSKYILLGTDGLWDELGRQQAIQISKNHKKQNIPLVLITKCLEKAALSANLTVEKIKQIPAGKKRNIHDDITIVLVDLQNQFK